MNRKELKNVRKMRGLGNKSASGYGILLISALLLLFFITLTFASQDFGISMDEEYYLGEDIYVIISGPSDAVFDVRVINPEGAIVFSDRKQTNNNGLSYIHMSGFTKPGAYTITLDLEGAILMEQFMVSDLSQTTTTITTTTTTTATTTTRTTTAQAPASTSTATTTVPTLTATSTSTTTETSTTISSTTHPEPSAIVVSVEFENDTVSYTESINHSNETNDTLIDPLKLITLEKHFRANEEPEFEIGDKVGGVGILGVTETPEARIEDFHGNIADVKPLIQEAGNKFKVTVPKERKVKPGLYKLVVESESNKEEIWFTWGLVTVNTRKSLYHPGEEAEILMVVLDKDGHLVSGARIHLQVTSPSGNETLYSNPKTIKELRNGIYRVFHETDEEGNYSLSVTAEAAGVIAYMNSYFTVKDF
ncbi:MAG: hypothetical protein B6U72_05335 [Candidatus Altiarchaeales archaeon ex4484_2]|nr:MAG: hypothetical protein B6U72_05335 [Candidatus Altiarchaeales archaeon ex4484_2]